MIVAVTDQEEGGHSMTGTSPSVAVIVLAAGAGTRMKSKTPKILHTIGGRSLVGHALHGTAGIDPEHLIAVVSHERERVSAAIGEIGAGLGVEIGIAEQDAPRGTGDAARVGLGGLPDDFDGTVVVTAADVPLLDADTLRALIDWGYRLLPLHQQELFCRLAVFQGGFTLEAAEGVCPTTAPRRGTFLS